MAGTGDRFEAPTRREYVKYGSAVVTTGLFAGCTGDGSTVDSGGGTETADGATTDGETADVGATDGETTARETSDVDGPYSVTMSPVGEVEFEAVPERAFTIYPQYADMAVALGHGDAIESLYVPEMSGTTMNRYYHHLDGVSFEWKGLDDPLDVGLSKEFLYALDSDVHLVDPAWVSTQNNWNRSDVDEIDTQIAPWFGNFYSGTRAPAPSGYENYEYYDLWELFGKVAEVFRERERYEALAAVRADLVSAIRTDLPPANERPTAVRVTLAGDGDSFWTYHLNEPGYWLADTRPLGARDAFADEDWGSLWGTVDYETMLEADPDVILHLWGMTPDYSTADARASLEDHPIGRQLTAVRNDRVYTAGMRYQGPLMNLFQLEMGAKQLYPDRFGEWPGHEEGEPYPDVPEDEWLFDRDRVAAITTGD